MTAAPQPEPQLQPPGAGLPLLQGLYLRYWLYPKLMRHYDGHAAVGAMTRETAKIISLSSALSDDDFFERVLIEPLPALEDSSRYWSVAMVMEHLIICMKAMTQIAEALAANRALSLDTSPANVKPKGGRKISRDEWVRLFTETTAECAGRLEAICDRPDVARPGRDAQTLSHPFFGAIPARGWIWVMGAHPVTHRRQVERIIAGLKH